MEKEPADESLQSSAAQPPNLRGSSVATLSRPSRFEQLQCCPESVETLRREAGICRIANSSKRATALTYEKAHRLPLDHPKRQILAAPSRHRLK